MKIFVPNKLNSPFRWILITITGGIIFIGGLTYKITKTSTLKNNLNNISSTAQKENLIINIKANGVLEPVESIDIGPKYPGRLVQLVTKQGEKVKQGQILALMERAEIRTEGKIADAKYNQSLAEMEAARIRIPSEIQQAQAQFIKVEARLEEIKTKLEQASKRSAKKIEELKKELVLSQSNLQLATSKMKRGEELLQEGIVNQNDFDKLVNDYHKATTIFLKNKTFLKQITNSQNLEINQLRQKVLQSKAEVTEAKIIVDERKKIAKNEFSRLESLINLSKAQLEQVVIKFEDTAIRSPYDGLVVKQYAKPGEFINPISASLNSVISLAKGLKVIAEIPEIDINKVQENQLVTITSDVYPGELFQGKVTRIFSKHIPADNVKVFKVSIQLITGQNKLSPETELKIAFLEKRIPNALTIPNNTIITKEGKVGVLLINEFNKPEFQSVVLGKILNNKTQVLSGLNPEDILLVNSFKQVNNI